MAKEKKDSKTDYSAVLRKLKDNGPEQLYVLWGEEDYLRESFYEELKKLCHISSSDFNYHRLNGAALDLQALSQAIDAVPFMGEHSLVELRNFDVNACKEDKAERLKEIIADLPEYVTVVFLLPTGYEPDGRLAAMKTLKKLGTAIEFTSQPQGLLIKWIVRRFEAMGKTIGQKDCEKLIFISGDLMTGLIPEIEKIGCFTSENAVTSQDIDAVAQKIPEASVFEMTDKLADKNYDAAASLLGELLQSGEHPIKILAMIGFQMRRLYTARIALDEGLGRDYLMEACKISYGFLADKLTSSAKGFTAQQLAQAVRLCAEADYRMKSSSEDDENILKELLLRIAVGDRA